MFWRFPASAVCIVMDRYYAEAEQAADLRVAVINRHADA